MTATIIIRHYKEKPAKCSLQPLLDQPEFVFHKAKPNFTYNASNHTLLGLAGEVISPADAGRPLLILDGTWRYLPAMEKQLTGTPCLRTLPPNLRTAYPRRSKTFTDPGRGLASIEALYAALCLLGQNPTELLSAYRWKAEFLQLNQDILSPPRA